LSGLRQASLASKRLETGPSIADQVCKTNSEYGAWRKELRIAQAMRLHDFAWMLIGVLLAVVAITIISRRRQRWF